MLQFQKPSGAFNPGSRQTVAIFTPTHNFNQVSSNHPHKRIVVVWRALQHFSDASGYKIVASEEIPPDATIVTCPFRLVITKELATHAILTVLKIDDMPSEWTERQLICTYVCLHWVFEA